MGASRVLFIRDKGLHVNITHCESEIHSFK